jgi:hypothetical protein
MPRRQWLGREHVERRAGKLAVLQRGEQIGFDQMLAAADLDQVAATEHASERVAVEDALGLRRQRQQVHENFGLAEHGLQAGGTVKAAHALRCRLCGPAPRHNWKTERSEVGGDPAADLAKAQNADRHVLRPARAETLPAFLALLCLIGRKAPLMPDHVPGHEARHHLRLRRVDDTDHVDVGAQAGTRQNVVDAGADRADRLQVGVAFECVIRRVPGHRQPDVRRRAVMGMVDDFDMVVGAHELRAEIEAKIEALANQDAAHRSWSRSCRLGR